MMPKSVRIFEVGPRDGLQNESKALLLQDRIQLINDLTHSGLAAIEVGSFVSPKAIPQMMGTEDVFKGIIQKPGVTYSALVPNIKGMEQAIEAGVTEIAVFAAASESFSLHNINCTIVESLERFKPVMDMARSHNIRVRGYVSCVMGCPYEGEVSLSKVAEVAHALFDMGCYEVSLGDTIGVGTPQKVLKMLDAVTVKVPLKHLALHCHDTYGQALANVYAAVAYGIRTIDASVGGLGGCPYAPGASGNVATEDVVYLLHGLGVETGVNLPIIIDTGLRIAKHLGRKTGSKVGQAYTPDNKFIK